MCVLHGEIWTRVLPLKRFEDTFCILQDIELYALSCSRWGIALHPVATLRELDGIQYTKKIQRSICSCFKKKLIIGRQKRNKNRRVGSVDIRRSIYIVDEKISRGRGAGRGTGDGGLSSWFVVRLAVATLALLVGWSAESQGGVESPVTLDMGVSMSPYVYHRRMVERQTTTVHDIRETDENSIRILAWWLYEFVLLVNSTKHAAFSCGHRSHTRTPTHPHMNEARGQPAPWQCPRLVLKNGNNSSSKQNIGAR